MTISLRILNALIDKYEASKSFIGENKVNQSFSADVDKLFPKYTDQSDYETFSSVNEAITLLVSKGYISAKKNRAKVYGKLYLNTDKLADIYAYIDRTPKSEINKTLLSLFEEFENENEILDKYVQDQKDRMNTNRSTQYFNGDIEELRNILKAVCRILRTEKEMYVRDLSVQLYKDSKLFESIAAKVTGLLYEYGDFPEREGILESLNIIKNPTYVNFKGAGCINIAEQVIDFSQLKGDIALSSSLIDSIKSVKVYGKGVLTIENLTSFNTFSDNSYFTIYLGGFHNTVRRNFIKLIHRDNPGVPFYHFGDIDAGGFYILSHLKRMTDIDFIPYKMDIDTLKKYSSYTKKLTANDKERLARLKDSEYAETVSYMLNNDCKLEQEAIH